MKKFRRRFLRGNQKQQEWIGVILTNFELRCNIFCGRRFLHFD